MRGVALSENYTTLFLARIEKHARKTGLIEGGRIVSAARTKGIGKGKKGRERRWRRDQDVLAQARMETIQSVKILYRRTHLHARIGGGEGRV